MLGRISEQRRSTKAEKIEALLENTDFSAEELKRWHKKFKKENPSGKITKKEIQDILGTETEQSMGLFYKQPETILFAIL